MFGTICLDQSGCFFTVSEDDSPVVMCDQPKFDWRSRRLLSYLALVFFQVDRHKEVVQCE